MAESDAQPQAATAADGQHSVTAIPPQTGRRGPKTFSSLQNHRNYRWLFTGNLFSNAAQWLQLLTVGWLVLDISGSALHSGTVVGIRTLPTLLLGPWAGVLADRWDRKKIAIITQLSLAVAAVVFATLVALGHVQVWHAYVFMAVTGIGLTVNQPVRQALIMNTVSRADRPNALALNAMAVTSMRLVGPIIGGTLIATAGYRWNFIVQAGMYVVMAMMLLPMRTPYREGGANRKVSGWANMVEGLRYVFQNRVLWRLNLMNFVRAAGFGALPLLLPAYTKGILHAGAGVGSMLLTVMGLGGLTATFIMATWGFFTKKGMVGLITLVTGSSCILLIGLSHWLWLSLPLLALMGFSQTHFIVSNQTLIQSLVADSMRGRISSLWSYEQGITPLFVFLLSLLAESRGIGFAMTTLGAASLVLSVFFFLRFTDNRTLD